MCWESFQNGVVARPNNFHRSRFKAKKYPHEDPLVIKAVLGKNTKYLLGNDVGGILVDNGSSADIITYELFKRIDFRDDQLQKTSESLYGFGNKKVEALGTIDVNVSLGTRALMRTTMVTFDVVDIPYAYKAVFGRGIINKFIAVIHMPFLCMKIPTANGILTIYGDQEDAHDREYNMGSNQKPVHIVENSEDTLQSEGEEEPKELEIKKKLCQYEKKRMQPHEQMKKVRLCEDVHDKTITIARGMTGEEEKALITCLRNNQDVFAWSKRNLRGVPHKVIEHVLRLDPKIPLKRQKLRVISPQKELAAQGEVDKLLDAGVIREIQFTTWLSNIVMV
jgi:hypothetical protein